MPIIRTPGWCPVSDVPLSRTGFQARRDGLCRPSYVTPSHFDEARRQVRTRSPAASGSPRYRFGGSRPFLIFSNNGNSSESQEIQPIACGLVEVNCDILWERCEIESHLRQLHGVTFNNLGLSSLVQFPVFLRFFELAVN